MMVMPVAGIDSSPEGRVDGGRKIVVGATSRAPGRRTGAVFCECLVDGKPANTTVAKTKIATRNRLGGFFISGRLS